MRECGGGLQLAYITDSFAKKRGGKEKKKGETERVNTEKKEEAEKRKRGS